MGELVHVEGPGALQVLQPYKCVCVCVVSVLCRGCGDSGYHPGDHLALSGPR